MGASHFRQPRMISTQILSCCKQEGFLKELIRVIGSQAFRTDIGLKEQYKNKLDGNKKELDKIDQTHIWKHTSSKTNQGPELPYLP
ncbi:hypothetical protein QL285_009202 [Trifolium repens]|nr:hypothetical protein QL285_009202 [Trifolium repens]